MPVHRAALAILAALAVAVASAAAAAPPTSPPASHSGEEEPRWLLAGGCPPANGTEEASNTSAAPPTYAPSITCVATRSIPGASANVKEDGIPTRSWHMVVMQLLAMVVVHRLLCRAVCKLGVGRKSEHAKPSSRFVRRKDGQPLTPEDLAMVVALAKQIDPQCNIMTMLY